MLLVRLVLFISLASIAVSFLLYLFTKKRVYLQFIGRVLLYTLVIMIGVLLFYLLERFVLIA